MLRNTDGVNNTPEGAHNPDSEPSVKVEDKSESPKLFGEEIIDDGKKVQIQSTAPSERILKARSHASAESRARASSTMRHVCRKTWIEA